MAIIYTAQCECGANAMELDGAIEVGIIRESETHIDNCNGEYSVIREQEES